MLFFNTIYALMHLNKFIFNILIEISSVDPSDQPVTPFPII